MTCDELQWTEQSLNINEQVSFKKAELTGKYWSMSDSTHLRNLEYVST